MGRKSLLKSTKKKPVASQKEPGSQDAERKKAILDGVRSSSDSIKAVLKKVGLAESTYYQWLKRYKADGVEGLKAGSPVSETVWKRFAELKKNLGETTQGAPDQSDPKLKAEEKQTMKSEKDNEKIRDLLFKKFDGGEKAGKKEKTVGEGARAAGASDVTDSGSVPADTALPKEPIDKTVKYAIGGFAVVLAVLLMSSFSNTTNFYFRQDGQKVELWQGRFAPMGERLVASFTGEKMPEGLPRKDSYSKNQAYSVLFDYLVQQADDILNLSRTPDLNAVKSFLMEAHKYAVNSAGRRAVQLRLNSINFLVLSGKADMALNRGTITDFEAAKAFLTEAIPYAATDIQKDIITKRLAAIEYAMATNKISHGEKQLAQQYREALDRHLRRAKAFSPEKSEEIDAEIGKITKWLEEFDKQHVGARR
jgi:transposase-like protein